MEQWREMWIAQMRMNRFVLRAINTLMHDRNEHRNAREEYYSDFAETVLAVSEAQDKLWKIAKGRGAVHVRFDHSEEVYRYPPKPPPPGFVKLEE